MSSQDKEEKRIREVIEYIRSKLGDNWDPSKTIYDFDPLQVDWDSPTVCALCRQVDCICSNYKCPCGKLETNCNWPNDEYCPCRICDELKLNCSCHKPVEKNNE
jgi:hypothetical protein